MSIKGGGVFAVSAGHAVQFLPTFHARVVQIGMYPASQMPSRYLFGTFERFADAGWGEKALILLARPEGFEPPTLRSVV
jgi:hypothetical protein